MNYIIEGKGALVNEAGEEQPLKAGDFVLVDPSEKHQYCNKGDVPYKMICGCRRSLSNPSSKHPTCGIPVVFFRLGPFGCG